MENSMDLNAVRIFVKVAELGTLSAAAAALRQPISTISRRLAVLERDLSVRLLNRTTRHLSLTDEGRGFFERMAPVIEEVVEAERALRDQADAPRGLLRVTATPLFASHVLAPAATRYINAYDDVEVQIIASNSRLDLVEEGLDLAIRAGRLEDSSLISRPLNPLPAVLVASPAYASAHGVPSVLDELIHHQAIMFSADAGQDVVWPFLDGKSVPVKGCLRVNSYEQVFQAVLAGAGIARLPKFLCEQALHDRRLVPVLADCESQPLRLHVVYPSRRQLSLKVRAFVDILAGVVAELIRDRFTK
jgi:DNA-binding transcriptional LysR family regulator